MKKYLFTILFILWTGKAFSAQDIVINCNFCSDTAKFSTANQYLQARLRGGEYRFIVLDMGFLSYSEFDVHIPEQSNPEFGAPTEGATISEVSRLNQSDLERYLQEAKAYYDEAFSQFGDDFIVLPAGSPYRSAYDALSYRSDFNSYVTNYTNNELNTVISTMKQGEVAMEKIAASLQVGLSALVSASISLQRTVTGTVQFRDGTSIKIKIDLSQDLSKGLELALTMTSDAYDAQGNLLPKNKLELKNFTANGTSFSSEAFGDYLKSKDISVFGLSGGLGGERCTTEWQCDSTGMNCTLVIKTCG
ncbi:MULTISPECIES: hypothetical protein [unclassified Pseudoalteromonas]|uniref:hypothetical protein n=1 Tax=unclassified Pseudoalteromonas TaxID=194690 RepID=UPI0005A6ABC8|nr:MULTISPECIES: hypothetical protein [unclassified Pseudoalteromonas]